MAKFTNVHLLEHTQIITNSFTQISGSEYYKGTLKLGALAGWKFDENQLYTMRLNTPTTGYKVKDATFNADFTEITFPMSKNDRINATSLERDVYFDGYLIETARTKEVSQTLTNCTSNAPTQILETDTEINITLSANDGFGFSTDDTPRIFILDTKGNPRVFYFTISNDKSSANIVFDVVSFGFDNINTFEIIANADAIPTPPRTKEVSQTLTNCTSNAPTQILETDTQLNITLSANPNAIFEIVPKIFIIDALGNPREFLFEVSSDMTSANIVFDVVSFGFDNINTFEIIANATIITPYSDKYGTINVYSVTDANLNDFAKQRFFKEITNENNGAPQYERIDLGKYVASLKRVYFYVEETTDNVLKCGNYSTNINVKTPLNDTLLINCGFVEIPNYNNNIVDYETEINLFLPFVGFVSLPSDYIGKTILLQYVCNLITADAIAKLICDNVVISVRECNLSNDLIYKTSDTPQLNSVGNVAFNMQVLKGLQPFANIKHFDALNTLYNNDCIRLQLSEVSGFAKIDEITNLNVNAIESEKELILSILQSGVIF